MKVRIGALTIGQSPREDLTVDIRCLMAEKGELVEAGALDNLSFSQILELYPAKSENMLITRLSNGQEVRLSENRLVPLLQEKINLLDEAGCDATLLLCTGNFHGVQSKALLVKMDAVLLGTVRAVAENHRLGIICPQEAQLGWMRKRWEQINQQVFLAVLDPLASGEECIRVAGEMRKEKVELVVMDCMGYSPGLQQSVRKASCLPVVLARGVALGILKEMYNF